MKKIDIGSANVFIYRRISNHIFEGACTKQTSSFRKNEYRTDTVSELSGQEHIGKGAIQKVFRSPWDFIRNLFSSRQNR